jgi:hypothetical protein
MMPQTLAQDFGQGKSSDAARPMISSEIMDTINDVEATFPVDGWRIDGVAIWPLVRIRWALDVFECSLAASGPPAASTGLRRARRRLFDGLGSLGRLARARLWDHNREAPLRGTVDAVLLSDGVSYLRLGGRAYERFCDPIITHLNGRDRATLLLNPLRVYPTPRFSSSRSVQPSLDLLRVQLGLARRLGFRPPRPGLLGFEEARAFLGSRGPIPSLALAEVAFLAQVIDVWAEYFAKVLRRAAPKAAFLVSYYCLVGFAFARACRRLGIPCVDLQHGVAGQLHPAYGRWHRVPADGYDLLPAVFWCWGDGDKAAIDSWAGRVPAWHRAVVGGNLLLEQWRAGRDDPQVADCDKRVLAMKTPGALHVLVTLQPGLTGPAALGPLLQAMPRIEEKCRLWVRLHPTMIGMESEVRRILPSSRVEITSSSELPLYGLLRHTDVHVTHSSSTVTEAAAFGVPSLVLSRYGLELFPEEVSQGWATLAEDAESVVKGLVAPAPRPSQPVAIGAGRALQQAYAEIASLVP